MNRALFSAFLFLLVLAPLPLGANREWSWSLLALLTGALSLLWALGEALRPAPASLRLPAGPAVLFLAVCGWILLQAAAITPASWAHPLWSLAGTVLGEPVPASVTLAREDTLTALMRLLSYGLVFALAYQLCADRRRAAALVRALSLAGLAYALFGLAAYWGVIDVGLWFPGERAHPAVRGPFVNRNSFATWLGLCLLCALGHTWQRLALRRNPAYSVPAGRQLRIERFLLQAWRPLAMLLLMTAALVLTHSRAGFGSFVAGALALTLAIHQRRRFQSARSLAAVAAAFAVGITAFLMTSEILLERMDRLNLDAPGRLDVYALTAEAIEDNPWLGFGYGTYADTFRLYRDDTLGAWYDKAHNSYLENIFELGWPAALALFAAVGWLALNCLQGLRSRGRDWIYPALGVAATVLVAVHSLFDFSLQIPAVAATYAALLGAACAQSLPTGARRPARPTIRRKRRGGNPPGPEFASDARSYMLPPTPVGATIRHERSIPGGIRFPIRERYSLLHPAPGTRRSDDPSRTGRAHGFPPGHPQ